MSVSGHSQVLYSATGVSAPALKLIVSVSSTAHAHALVNVPANPAPELALALLKETFPLHCVTRDQLR